VEAVEDILKVDGVDAVFMGPSDLAASMGLLGQQEHPEVRSAVEHCLSAARAAGKPAGVNAFNPDTAQHYLANGAAFILVGADVALLARGSEALAGKYIKTSDGDAPASY
jgi:4-hydroxy-2-oxoheptanedioate aldolase